MNEQVIASASITGGWGRGGSGDFPATINCRPWHYNSSTHVIPPVKKECIEKRSFFNAYPPLYLFANSSTDITVITVTNSYLYYAKRT